MYFSDDFLFAIRFDQINNSLVIYTDARWYSESGQGGNDLVEVSFFDPISNAVDYVTAFMPDVDYVLRLQNYVLYVLQNPPIKETPAFDNSHIDFMGEPFAKYGNLNLYRVRLHPIAYGQNLTLSTLATGMFLKQLLAESKGDNTLALMNAARRGDIPTAFF